MKKCLFIYALLCILAAAGCEKGELVPLCILHTNDVHGHIVPERVEGWSRRMGGAAVLAGCVAESRARNRALGIPTLLLDAGDIFVGTPEGCVSKGVAVVEIMNHVGYDAMAVGNHEFDMGVDVLENLARAARFPILAANATNSADGSIPPYFTPYLVKECGALTVGIVGIITEATPEIVMPGRTEKIIFKNPEQVLRDRLAELEAKGADFIIVLSHCGAEEDRRLASRVRGIGVIVGGHGHELMRNPVRIRSTGTLILQAGGSGQYLGMLAAQVDPRSHRVEKYRYEITALEVGKCAPDPAVGAIVKKWTAKVGEQFDGTVGRADSDFPIGEDGESALGDLIADSMCAATGADIAFTNSYGIRNPLLRGPVSYRDIYMTMPFDNTLYTMTLTGGQVREILEQSLAEQILHVAGLRLEYRRSAPKGKKIVSVTCGSEPLDEGRSYKVVTNSFLSQGGDGFKTFLKGRGLANTGVLDRDAMGDYIKARSPISAAGFTPERIIPR